MYLRSLRFIMFNEYNEMCETQLNDWDRDRDTHSDVVLGEEHADDDRREFGRGRAGCHECRTSDVGR